MLVALGGGVVGDIAGFAAATLLRGIDFVQIPTTLLAQVDSSVGGKTAINTAAGKNLLGAFYQPRLVLADTGEPGQTLPRREVRAGYGEIVKYGLIRDAGFFDWLEAEGRAVCDLEPAALTRAVMVSCRMKAEIVAGDEREAGDARAAQFRPYLRPCAGGRDRLRRRGCCTARRWRSAWCWPSISRCGSGSPRGRTRTACAATSPRPGCRRRSPSSGLPATAADRLLAHMGKDKKVRDGRITLILPRRIGDAL